MAGLPNASLAAERALPEYLPARMLNEFVYCPRLFLYEWVEGLFRDSAATIEGKAQHRRVDEKITSMPSPEQLGGDKIHSRSVTLSSDRHRLIARIDLVEAAGGLGTAVDYKHGRPRQTDDGLEPWPADKAQLAAQAIILRENGVICALPGSTQPPTSRDCMNS